MKFLIIVTDGVGVQNFLCTPLVGMLLAKGKAVVWHALSNPREKSGARQAWLRQQLEHPADKAT